MKSTGIPYTKRFNQKETRTLLSGGVIFNYLATGEETNGQFTMFEARGIPGMEPPPHRHEHEDETFYLLSGEILFTIGEVEFLAKAGDYVFMPRKVRHQFKILSNEFRALVSIHPAGLEHYFEPLSVPYAENVIPPINQTPPSKEALAMMQKLNEKFGIYYD